MALFLLKVRGAMLLLVDDLVGGEVGSPSNEPTRRPVDLVEDVLVT